jgi:hypothetical protein
MGSIIESLIGGEGADDEPLIILEEDNTFEHQTRAAISMITSRRPDLFWAPPDCYDCAGIHGRDVRPRQAPLGVVKRREAS